MLVLEAQKMSNTINDYGELECMPTDDLKTLLKLDISETSGMDLSIDTILHIFKIISKREAQNGVATTNIEDVWKVFEENYKPSFGKP